MGKNTNRCVRGLNTIVMPGPVFAFMSLDKTLRNRRFISDSHGAWTHRRNRTRKACNFVRQLQIAFAIVVGWKIRDGFFQHFLKRHALIVKERKVPYVHIWTPHILFRVETFYILDLREELVNNVFTRNYSTKRQGVLSIRKVAKK